MPDPSRSREEGSGVALVENALNTLKTLAEPLPPEAPLPESLISSTTLMVVTPAKAAESENLAPPELSIIERTVPFDSVSVTKADPDPPNARVEIETASTRAQAQETAKEMSESWVWPELTDHGAENWNPNSAGVVHPEHGVTETPEGSTSKAPPVPTAL